MIRSLISIHYHGLPAQHQITDCYRWVDMGDGLTLKTKTGEITDNLFRK